MFAVQGDNFFAASPYTICVVPGVESSPFIPDIGRIERELVEDRNDLLPFRAEFFEAQQRFEQAKERYERETVKYVEKQNSRGRMYEGYFADALKHSPLVVEQDKRGRLFRK